MSRRGLGRVRRYCFRRCRFRLAPALAQDKPTIKVSSLTLPVFNPLVWNIMKAQGFDAKHGFKLDIHAYPSISAFYAAFATGETDALIGGPTILQKLYQEGVPVRIIGTGFTLSDLVIFAKEPSDQVARRSQGQATGHRHGRLAISGGQDLCRCQRHRSRQGHHGRQRQFRRRARAARSRPRRRRAGDRAAGQHHPQGSIRTGTIIFNGAEGWKEITGEDGWEIVPAMRADAIAKMPERARRCCSPPCRTSPTSCVKDTDGRRQDRQRDAQAAAWHSHGRGRGQAAANDRQAGLGPATDEVASST